MQSALRVSTRVRSPLARVAAVRQACAHEQRRGVASGSTGRLFSRANAQKNLDNLRKWANTNEEAKSVLQSLRMQYRLLATEGKPDQANSQQNTQANEENTTKSNQENTSGATGSEQTGNQQSQAGSGSPYEDPQRRARRARLAIILFPIILLEALSIYTLYVNNIQSDWIQYCAFVPGLQWIPALELAGMSMWWALFPLVQWPLDKALTGAFLSQRTLGRFIGVQVSWISMLAFLIYRNYRIAEHFDAGNIWTAVGMSLNPLKWIFWPSLAAHAEQYGRTPNYVTKTQLEQNRENMLPGQSQVVVLPPAIPPTKFVTSAWRRVEEVAAGKRDASNNLVLRWTASAASAFGVGAAPAEPVAAAPATPTTAPTAVVQKPTGK